MLRTISILLFMAVAYAADLTYIMALKPPVTSATFKQARADVEAAGGKVTYEFHSSIKAVLVSLPSQEMTTFSSKPYVDFIEEDRSVHIN